MHCEVCQVVQRRCVRCFLIRPAEFRDNVVCEQPRQRQRNVSMHQLATEAGGLDLNATNP